MSSNPDELEGYVEFTGIGNSDRMLYDRADFAKVCRISEIFALSFYQMDYQALANHALGVSDLDPSKEGLMVVSKIAMDRNGFLQLKKEIDEIYEKSIAKKI
ncbi:hypothetical protein [Leptospira andrefontaineae]|uniref:Uncharacterized protein n=1 Tax=Leptospira andrefontaineae TaxID=2484976 RepID=A0A4R9GX35_9LEPT|nr:hypothetical protein [Leptospira andrefontaineae]TGK36257.1 hypothetical protein EHO65_18320 [Leptospira andrefontaineae]